MASGSSTFAPFKSGSAGIWCYYLRDAAGQKAQCLKCKKILKCVGGSTKGLHVHQQTAHGIDTLKKEADDQQPAAKKPKLTMLDYFPTTSGEDKSMDAVLARMTARDGFPFSAFVTSPDLRKCFAALGHELPRSTETIKKKVCLYADQLKEKVRLDLQQRKRKEQLFSLTLDEWTSIRGRRYFNVNIHGRDVHWNLGLQRICGVFSSEKCKEAVSLKLLEFGIDFDTDIVGVTTDGCSMMVKFGHLIAPLHLLCYAHGIHLAVMDVLYAKAELRKASTSTSDQRDTSDHSDSNDEEDDISPFHADQVGITDENSCVIAQENIATAVKKARSVVKLFKRSPQKSEILAAYMRQDGFQQELALILDCKTRWDSLINMLERLVLLKSPVLKALIDVNANFALTEGDFHEMSVVVSALKPVQAAVDALCRRDATLLTAEATVKFLLEELQQQPHSVSTQLREALRQRIIEERYTDASVVLAHLHNPQALLAKKPMVKNFCCQLLTRLQMFNAEADVAQVQSCDPGPVLSAEGESPPRIETVASRLQKAIAAASSVPKAVSECKDLPIIINNELTVAAQSGQRGRHLERVYQSLLTIPPTSVEAERAFSSAGYLCNKVRSSLHDVTLDKLCFLRAHLRTCC